MVVDLAQVTHLSSAGMLALHQIAVLLRGETPPDPEAGWAAIHALADDLDRGMQPQIKLLAPSPRARQALERAGLTALFEIVTDLDMTLAAFAPTHASSQPTRPTPRYLRALNSAVRTPRPSPTPTPC
jgi:anti-anti-sigma regulatory factor